MSNAEVNGALLLLGKGKLYFDRFDANGAKTGERFLGNCTKLEGTVTDDLREKYSSATSDAPLMKAVNVKRLMEVSITLDEFDEQNVALAIMGTTTVLAQTLDNTGVTDEQIVGVRQGYWYQVTGKKRNLNTVVVKVGAATKVITTDYLVDAVTGRIYIVPGGGIADAATILVTYKWGADTSKVVYAGQSSLIEGYLHFIGDPATGPAWEAEIWKVQFSPDGAISWIGDEFAEFGIKGKILDDSANHPDYPLYRMIRMS